LAWGSHSGVLLVPAVVDEIVDYGREYSGEPDRFDAVRESGLFYDALARKPNRCV
jgi:hypothetical protein